MVIQHAFVALGQVSCNILRQHKKIQLRRHLDRGVNFFFESKAKLLACLCDFDILVVL